MLEGIPSQTALSVALRRAAHQLHDRPIVFLDPIAVPLLGRLHLERLRAVPRRSSSLALRAFLVARSRYAEDLLAAAVRSGVTQYLILGAGLDTFAYRNPYRELRVFELDHPATQLWKRSLLAAAGIPVPASLTYVAADFEHQSLASLLVAAGFQTRTPTFISWLGVVPYLTLEAFRGTVSVLASLPTGSAVTLDYGQPREVLSPLEQKAIDSLSSRVAQRGEPFQLFFTPEQIAAEFRGFSRFEDLGREAINARYFEGRTDQLRLLSQAGRFFTAWR